MKSLEDARGNSRDEYPCRATWNSILAGVVYQHPSIEALRRVLSRNVELRKLCGFDPMRGAGAVPPPWAHTRFLESLLAHEVEIRKMFHNLVEKIREYLTDPGAYLDRVMGFELHTIRGLARVEARVGIALVAMLSMALGRLRNGQKDQVRSLLAPADRKAA